MSPSQRVTFGADAPRGRRVGIGSACAVERLQRAIHPNVGAGEVDGEPDGGVFTEDQSPAA